MLSQAFPLTVGWLSRAELVAALQAADVHLNASAQTMLDAPVFGVIAPQTAPIVECTVGDLGLSDGTTMPEIVEAARSNGLGLCPAVTGPYLRLSKLNQEAAPDSVLSKGQPPSGAITIASPQLMPGSQHPRGFYLRVIGAVIWLRGYRCTDDAPWSRMDQFAFRRIGAQATSE